MASDASVQRQDTTSLSDYQQQQPRYLNDSQDKHEAPQIRFVQIDQQHQQQQLYESHQLHGKSFGIIQGACSCYQSGSEQVCPRCQTNEGQNNAGTFIYQTVQANLDPQPVESQAQNHQQPQNIVIGEPHQSATGCYLQSAACDGEHSDDFQEPPNGNDIKYYVKQAQHPTEQSSYNSSNPISVNLVRCQTTCSFDNSISSSNNIIENDAAASSSDALFYQCSSNNNNNETLWQGTSEKVGPHYETISSRFSPLNQDKPSFAGCNIVDSNNNSDATQHQQQRDEFPTAQYSAIPQIKKPTCQQQQRQLEYYHLYDDGSHQFTSAAHQQQQQPQYAESYQQQQLFNESSFDRDAHQQATVALPLAGDNSYSSTGQHHYDDQPQQQLSLQADLPPLESARPPYVVDSAASANQQLRFQLSNHSGTPSSSLSSSPSSSSCPVPVPVPVPVQNQQQQFAPDQESSGTEPSKPSNNARTRRLKNPVTLSKVNGKLWEFIRDLLLSDRTNPAFIRWERREDGVFKFVQSNKVAKMWGERKQNPKMTYEKLSRAMRYYYKSKVLLPVFGRRLVYKFGPNASGWNQAG